MKIKLKKPPTPAEISAWARSLNFSSFSIIMVLLLVLGVLILSPGISTLIDQRRQIAELEASVKQHSEAVDEIDAERDRWKDPAYVRAEARDRLFFVMPGETQMSVIDDMVVAEPVHREASAKLTAVKHNWLRALATSVVTSGVTVATPEELSR